MSRSTRDIPHCTTHRGLPLPCYRCATPVPPAEASSVRNRSPATTSEDSLRRRLAHERAARQGGCDACQRRGPLPDVTPVGWFTIAVYRLDDERVPHSKHLCRECAAVRGPASVVPAGDIGQAVLAACGQQAPVRAPRAAPMLQMHEKTHEPAGTNAARKLVWPKKK